MDNNIEEKCKILLYDYHRYKKNAYKIKARNKLFELMRQDFNIWIFSILKKWGRSLTREEVVSLSWDCFEYCISIYEPSFDSFLGHFYKYTKYYLLMNFAKKDTVRIEITELKEILKIDNSPELQIFEKLLTLQQFRGVIPEEQLNVWDEAALSLDSSFRGHLPRKVKGMSTESYTRLKKAFINIIRLILK